MSVRSAFATGVPVSSEITAVPQADGTGIVNSNDGMIGGESSVQDGKPMRPASRRSMNLSRVSSSSSYKPSRAASAALTDIFIEGKTVVSDAMASKYKCTTLPDLCNKLGQNLYIPPQNLKHIKLVGQGAYAEVCSAELLGVYESNDAPKEDDIGTINALHWQERSPGIQRNSCQKFIVAVKTLKPEVLVTEESVYIFVEEIRTLSKVQHRNIVGYLGIGCHDPSSRETEWRSLYLVQEFMAGGTLKNLLLRQALTPFKPLYPLTMALAWAIDVAEAIAFLHTSRPMIIHRDLKLENILITGGKLDVVDDNVRAIAKVGDLGLARLVYTSGMIRRKRKEAKLAAAFGSASCLTPVAGSPNDYPSPLADATNNDESTYLSSETNNTVATNPMDAYKLTGVTGAFTYMAPEVLRSLPYNERVDVFSFGIILYELFARRLVGSDLMNTMEWDESVGFAEKMAAGWRPRFPQHMPEEVRRLVDCCWSGTPELRPTMSDVLLRLKALQREGVVGATTKSNDIASKSAGKIAQAPTDHGANACCSVM